MTLQPHYERDGVKVYNGDCLDVMRQMEDNSVDTIITDPPYGLSNEPDMTEVLTHWLNGDDYDHGGGGFMNAQWDSFVPGPVVWREVFRVMKPGGALLAMAGTRTADLLSIAIRLAGFRKFDEISYHYAGSLPPQIDYVYGSGFPKSLSISKAIDKAAGAEREVVKVWKQTYSGLAGKENGYRPNNYSGKETSKAPATEAARTWSGYGSALKPAHEIILCFYKPREGTYSENALTWGVAGLNIDGARVGLDGSENLNAVQNGNIYGGNGIYGKGNQRHTTKLYKPSGRWPANLLHDGSPEVVGRFPVTTSKDGGKPIKRNGGHLNGYDGGWGSNELSGYNDSGSAARFFYCAKASKAERTANGAVDNKHPTVKPLSLMEYLCTLTRTPTGGVILDPFAGSGTTLLAARRTGRQAIGIEMSAEYCEIIRGRLEAEPKAEARQLSILEEAAD